MAVPGVSFAAPNDATLQALTLSAGMLDNPFDPNVTSYTASESAGQTSITVTPMTTDPGATVTANGASVAFNTASGAINLNVGANTVTIVVTSQDTTATKTYTITVNRAASADAYLNNLVLSSGTLSPAFDANTTSYTASVSSGTASVTVTPTLSDTNASLTVDTNPATSGAAYGPVSLNFGVTSIGVMVTAQDGTTTKTYTVTITRPTPGTAQTITFNNPGAQNFGTAPSLSATATSALTVAFTSSTTGVCTITAGGALTFVSAGTCTINADQAGNGTYQAAPQVTQSFTVNAVVPGAPTVGTATAGDTQATVAFTAPASNGGSAITGYTVTSNPGGFTGTGMASPITVTGLTNGTAYTFSVTATNSAGAGSASAASNSVTPKASQTITFANPGAQTFGTSPTLSASSTSSLTVAFSSSTTGICTVTSGGVLTFVSTGACTINADQAGNGGFLAATTVSRSFTVNAVAPGAPTIGSVTPGNGQVGVAFTAPASNGGATITGYTVTSSPGGFTGTGASSPLLVTGLTNGVAYTFTVTATNSVGTSSASGASASATPSLLSSDATLSGLTLSAGSLSPAFAGGTTSYTASVANAFDLLTVTPTVNESHATVKVNGTTVTSGSASGAVALAVGSNTITVLATAQDGTTTQTYTLTVTRAAAPPPVRSNNAALSAVALSSGTLDRAFAANDAAPYKASVSSGTASITVTPTTADSNAAVEVSAGGAGFIPVTSGSASGAISLNVGTTAILVRVTAQGGATKLYEIDVIRAASPSNDADLSGIEFCVTGPASYCATPTQFSPATIAYTLDAVGSLQIVPTTADPGATVTVNGTAVGSGKPSAAISLPAGMITPVAVVVTARDGTTKKTYTVTAGKAAPSADLSALDVSGGTLSPAFDPATVGYTLRISSDTPTITLTPTAKDPAATIKVYDQMDHSAPPLSGPISVRPGSALSLAVRVTAAGNGSLKDYYINVSRPFPVTVVSLSAPAVGKVGSPYQATFMAATSDRVTWTSTDLPPGLTLTTTSTSFERNKAIVSGTPTKAGPYSFTLTASDDAYGGLAKGSITQTVTIAEGPSDADLDSLRVSAAGANQTLSPTFDRSTSEYKLTVPAGTSSVNVAGIPHYQGAWILVAVNGQTMHTGSSNFFSTDVPLTGASTKITVVTTLGSSSTTYDGPSRTYTLTVNQVAAAANADLQGLSLGAGGTLSTPFAPDTLAYKATATNETTSLQIIAPPADANAKLKLNGAATSSPMTGSLNVGDNVFKIAVTSADGTVTKTYTLTVTRAKSSAAKLSSLALDSGALGSSTAGASTTYTPNFSPDVTSYAVTVPPNEDSIYLAYAASPGSMVQVGMSGPMSETGRVPASLEGDGPTAIKVLVTSEDRTASTLYTITVTRAAPPLTVTASLPTGTMGKTYSGTVKASGGKAPYTYQVVLIDGVSDQPPPGLSLSSDGALSGTPTSMGQYTFGVKATDANGATGQAKASVELFYGGTVEPVRLTVSLPQTGPQISPFQVNLAADLAQATGVPTSRLATITLPQTTAAPTAATASASARKAAGGKASASLMTASTGQAAASGAGPVLTYTPYANGMGLDQIVVEGIGLDGAPAAVALEIQVPGKAPDLTASVAANGLVRLDPTASVIGGPFMGLQILSPPAFGQVSVSGLQLIYTPDPTHLGDTSFVYAVDLGFGLSAPGTVTVTTGQAVTAPSLTATAYAGQKVSLDLTSGAQGGPFTGASVLSISPSTAGAAAIHGTGSGTYALDFTPSTSFTGPATVRYALAGAGGGSAVAEATITVLARPDPSVDADLRGLISASDQAVKTFARTQTDNFNGRLESLRSGGGRGGFDMKLGFSTPSGGQDPRDAEGPRLRRLAQQGAPDPTAAPVAAGSAATDARPSGAGAAPAKPSPWGSWVGGTIQIGHVDASTQRRDYRLSTSGLSAGVDYRLSDHLVIGAGLGYGEDKVRIGSKGSRLDGDSKVAAAYGAWLGGPGVFVDGVLGYGRLNFDVTRHSTEADTLLTGSRTGDMTFGSFRAGLDRTRGGLHVSPYGAVSFIDGRLGAFSETGDPGYALSYAGQDVQSLASTLGLKLEERTKLGYGRYLLPRLRLEWRHEFDGAGDQVLSYADSAGSPRYLVPGDQLGRDDVSFEFGGRLQLDQRLSLDLGYRAFFSSGARSQTWNLKLDDSF